ncbi:MAG: glycosyltransferase family 2 protein [Halioglobus sp.]|nr:glycosyltransferase family 2 protein [Halioglobus sp.]
MIKLEKIELSVVIPVYHSAAIFPTLYERLVTTLEGFSDSFEIIAVVDGCTDNSADVIANVNKSDARVKLIEFSRNFGNQMAITAGLQYAKGDTVIVIDDDLEDPPEVIPGLVKKSQEGFDVVYAVRKKRHISWLQHRIFKAYYTIFSKLSNYHVPEDVGDFCLMRRPVVDALNAMPESHRYVRGLRSWAGFRQTGFEFDRQARHSGRSGFSLAGYSRFAFDAIFSFSHTPLFVSTYLGFAIALISFLLGIGFVVAKLLGLLPDVPGWASLVVIVLFSSGIQLLSIGVLGQYIGRIYDEVKKRPPYIVKRSLGLEMGTSAAENLNSKNSESA